MESGVVVVTPHATTVAPTRRIVASSVEAVMDQLASLSAEERAKCVAAIDDVDHIDTDPDLRIGLCAALVIEGIGAIETAHPRVAKRCFDMRDAIAAGSIEDLA